jgi:hypothetical protein
MISETSFNMFNMDKYDFDELLGKLSPTNYKYAWIDIYNSILNG